MARVVKFRPRHQPRIPGTTRVQKGSALIPEVYEGLVLIAHEENKTVSWVVDEIVCDFFGIDSRTGRPLPPTGRRSRQDVAEALERNLKVRETVKVAAHDAAASEIQRRFEDAINKRKTGKPV